MVRERDSFWHSINYGRERMAYICYDQLLGRPILTQLLTYSPNADGHLVNLRPDAHLMARPCYLLLPLRSPHATVPASKPHDLSAHAPLSVTARRSAAH